MSEFDQDPSANTAGFRAFVDRHEEDSATSRRSPASPAVLVIACVAVLVIILIVTLA